MLPPWHRRARGAAARRNARRGGGRPKFAQHVAVPRSLPPAGRGNSPSAQKVGYASPDRACDVQPTIGPGPRRSAASPLHAAALPSVAAQQQPSRAARRTLHHVAEAPTLHGELPQIVGGDVPRPAAPLSSSGDHWRSSSSSIQGDDSRPGFLRPSPTADLHHFRSHHGTPKPSGPERHAAANHCGTPHLVASETEPRPNAGRLQQEPLDCAAAWRRRTLATTAPCLPHLRHPSSPRRLGLPVAAGRAARSQAEQQHRCCQSCLCPTPPEEALAAVSCWAPRASAG
mmetsp:Transcript_101644/g.242368  ORF Transcript_101644/g.242368 Transcript_101644/m.242368 type:complete len:286 (+) Transcript_101644:764-1621(+)